tara:strand:- start:3133 stop:6666 length:3534 start_codon:yes stop_codon:yes gene_type:complete
MNCFKTYIILLISIVFTANNVKNNNFELIESSQYGSTIIFNAEEIELEIIDGIHSFKKNENIGLTMVHGKPQLPVYSMMYQVNPDKKYEVTYDILESEIIENVNLENYNNLSDATFDDDYENNLYVSPPQIMRDIVINQIGFTPYEYNSSKKELKILKTVKINVKESGESNQEYFLPEKKSRVFAELYQNSVINYTPSNRDEDYQTPSILYICGGNACNNSYVKELIEWRRKQGYLVTVATTLSNDADGLNNDSESAIDNFISSQYNSDNPPEIVGLIGDVNGSYDIACDFYQWGSGYWSSYYGASDVKYTYIQGNDLLPEIVIGRISAESSGDLANIINKTLQYEKGNYQQDSYYERAALIGDPTVGSGISPAITCQQIKELMLHHGVENVFADLNGGGAALEDFLVDNFNAGSLYYNFRGIQNSPGCYITNSIANSMVSTYNNPFAVILTCATGDFEDDAFSEDFIRIGSVANPKGAVAAIGMSTTATHTAYNNIIDMGIFDGIFSKNLTHGGSATTNGRIAMYETYPANPGDIVGAFAAYCNLMGDPALHLWTDTPKDFDVELPNSIPLGTNHFNMFVKDTEGNFVNDARVTLYKENNVIAETGLTDESGYISFTWDNQSSGDMFVTLTKKNFRPSENVIQINDDYAIDINWDENLEANPGDSYTFPEININSIGNDNISWITGELTSNSDLVEIVSGNTSWIYMTPDDWMGNQEPLIINVSENAIYGDDINLILNLTDDNDNNWSIYVPFEIISPKIDIYEYTINGRLDPGNTVEVYFQLINNGNYLSENIELEIDSDSYLVSESSNSLEFGQMDPGDIAISTDFISLSFAQSILNGSVFPIKVKIKDSGSYDKTEIINLTIGTIRPNDPVGPDPHGYYIYDYSDQDYDLAPTYNWIEIDPSYNSVVQSQDLNLSDGGNGNNEIYSIETINLPFEFYFYGEPYSQITVSTNGWVVFGQTLARSFRNHSVPGAGGPSPMVAVFWDDMKTTSSGDVFYAEYDENQDGLDDVIIEWSDMRTYDNNDQEDFQIIFYQGNNSDSGDGEMKLQYKEFNNTSDGYYPQGGGGYNAPRHGCYATIGIENKLGNVGLEYTFNNEYRPGAASLSDGKAIFITTTSPFKLFGDVNGDEILNVLDVVILVNLVLSNQFEAIGDMNSDGILNVLDIVILVGIVLGN